MRTNLKPAHMTAAEWTRFEETLSHRSGYPLATVQMLRAELGAQAPAPEAGGKAEIDLGPQLSREEATFFDALKRVLKDAAPSGSPSPSDLRSLLQAIDGMKDTKAVQFMETESRKIIDLFIKSPELAQDLVKATTEVLRGDARGKKGWKKERSNKATVLDKSLVHATWAGIGVTGVELLLSAGQNLARMSNPGAALLFVALGYLAHIHVPIAAYKIHMDGDNFRKDFFGFQQHHRAEMDATDVEYEKVATNWAKALAAPALGLAILNPLLHLPMVISCAAVPFMIGAMLMQWSHVQAHEAPADTHPFAKLLQKWGFFLDPKTHAKHHQINGALDAPHNNHYDGLGRADAFLDGWYPELNAKLYYLFSGHAWGSWRMDPEEAARTFGAGAEFPDLGAAKALKQSLHQSLSQESKFLSGVRRALEEQDALRPLDLKIEATRVKIEQLSSGVSESTQGLLAQQEWKLAVLEKAKAAAEVAASEGQDLNGQLRAARETLTAVSKSLVEARHEVLEVLPERSPDPMAVRIARIMNVPTPPESAEFPSA